MRKVVGLPPLAIILKKVFLLSVLPNVTWVQFSPPSVVLYIPPSKYWPASSEKEAGPPATPATAMLESVASKFTEVMRELLRPQFLRLQVFPPSTLL